MDDFYQAEAQDKQEEYTDFENQRGSTNNEQQNQEIYEGYNHQDNNTYNQYNNQHDSAKQDKIFKLQQQIEQNNQQKTLHETNEKALKSQIAFKFLIKFNQQWNEQKEQNIQKNREQQESHLSNENITGEESWQKIKLNINLKASSHPNAVNKEILKKSILSKVEDLNQTS